MTTASIYGGVTQSSGLYGTPSTYGGATYFQWFVFQANPTGPSTPTGGSWDFTTNTGTPPTGWSVNPPVSPTSLVWVSYAIVNSRTPSTLVWSTPGQFAYSSGAGLPVLSGSNAPLTTDGQIYQFYVQLTTPRILWFRETGGWVQTVGPTDYVDLTSNQIIGGTKTFNVVTATGGIAGGSF
jgi:hypothetical protein